MARSSGSEPGDVQKDWNVVQQHLLANGRDPGTLTFGATQFLHVVEGRDRQSAMSEQMPLFLEIMGGHRTTDDLQASYLTGTIDDMLSTINKLREAGLQYLILTPLVDDPGQLELITRHIVEPLGSRSNAGSGPGPNSGPTEWGRLTPVARAGVPRIILLWRSIR